MSSSPIPFSPTEAAKKLGSLAGMRNGIDSIDPIWFEICEGAKEMDELAKQMFEISTTSSSGERQ